MKSDISPTNPILPAALPWQIDLLKQLLNLQQHQQLPHAILIELETVADSRCFGWQLIMALLCQSSTDNKKENSNDSKPCGQCQSCRLMLSNNYPDFIFTTLQENEKTHKLNKDIKIDQVRSLIHRMSLTDSLGAGKYALIYPAERMNLSSSNSLLKTLEEPTPGSTLILLTHNAGRLPITIRSRCQKWRLSNPDKAAAMNWMKQQSIEQNRIEEYLSLSHGDAQLTLQLYQQDFTSHRDHFQHLLECYIGDQIDVVSLVKDLKILDSGTLRLILKTELMSRIYHEMNIKLTEAIKLKLAGLLDLLKHSDQILRIEDNNLNLQLQLEDVLISLKRVLNKR